ncbi:MAG: hypothetical protein WCY93_09365 [Anaerolineaceae bacterium]
MLKPNVTCIGTIKDIQNHGDLILVTDPLKIEHILDYLGYPAPGDEYPIEFSGLFVLVVDGDYKEVYGFDGYVAYLYKDLWRIDTQ